MGRDKNTRGRDTGRDPGNFIALPWVVVDSHAYQTLSHPAKSLLLEIARQFVRDNNGRLLASRAYLAKRGWKSADTISRALKELVSAKLIHQTVQGHRPNKASWYAVTWRTLDRLPGYDAGAVENFRRGAYADVLLKNTKLRPPDGLGKSETRPSDGQEKRSTSPPGGAVTPIQSCSASPLGGHHLEKPSLPTKDFQTEQSGIPDAIRVRDCDQRAADFDPITGEYFASLQKTSSGRQSADAWVADALLNRQRT